MTCVARVSSCCRPASTAAIDGAWAIACSCSVKGALWCMHICAVSEELIGAQWSPVRPGHVNNNNTHRTWSHRSAASQPQRGPMAPLQSHAPPPAAALPVWSTPLVQPPLAWIASPAATTPGVGASTCCGRRTQNNQWWQWRYNVHRGHNGALWRYC